MKDDENYTVPLTCSNGMYHVLFPMVKNPACCKPLITPKRPRMAVHSISMSEVIVNRLAVLLMAQLVLAGCEGNYRDVTIVMEDFRFSPNQVRVSGGKPIRLSVYNGGRETHIIQSAMFKRNDVRVALEDRPHAQISENAEFSLKPGETVHLIIEAGSGLYWYRCPLKGHQGMEGMIKIE